MRIVGTPHMTLLTTLMWECNLERLQRLQCMEGLVPLWEEGLPERLGHLRCLLLNSCGLTAIPPGMPRHLKGLHPYRCECHQCCSFEMHQMNQKS